MSASAEHAAEVLQATLADISTTDLINELAHREGVSHYVIDREEYYTLTKGGPQYHKKTLENYVGPVRILTVVS